MAKKIVVIDDEQNVCDLLEKLFTQKGYKVKTSVSAGYGLDLVEQENPDCILLDIKMPEMDGIEVLSRIKKINDKAGVIIITGYGNIENAIESMKLGAFDYITKPFDLDFIVTLVERCIDTARGPV